MNLTKLGFKTSGPVKMLIGAGVGGGIGALSNEDHRTRNALIGAGLGALTGAGIQKYREITPKFLDDFFPSTRAQSLDNVSPDPYSLGKKIKDNDLMKKQEIAAFHNNLHKAGGRKGNAVLIQLDPLEKDVVGRAAPMQIAGKVQNTSDIDNLVGYGALQLMSIGRTPLRKDRKLVISDKDRNNMLEATKHWLLRKN